MQAKQMRIGKNTTGTIVRPTAALQSGEFLHGIQIIESRQITCLIQGHFPHAPPAVALKPGTGQRSDAQSATLAIVT